MQELTLQADLEHLEQALSFVDSQAEALGCPMRKQLQLQVAVEELFVNVASYAYAPGSGPVTLQAEVEQSPLTLVIRLIDRGIPYNPLEKADPDVHLPVQERQIGGLGILLAKKNLDELQYDYLGGCNILSLKKRI